jgi:branched-subunit amino acid aminotransferase/4-amino-4-deoxychorismate lyase
MGARLHEIGSTLAWRPDASGGAEAFTVVEWCDPHANLVAVADSFRVAGGAARGVAEHGERFVAGVRTVAGAAEADTAAAFWGDALETLRAVVRADPAHPPLFPRVERRERGDYRLLLRPSPPVADPQRGAGVVLATADHDPRQRPRTKGPDLERLSALRTQAQAVGADEAVIVDDRGRLIEGAYSAILWTHGDHLSVVADDAPRIPSVTERLVRGAAERAGRAIAAERPALAELDGAAVWVLSALHGARAANRWIAGPRLRRDDALDAWVSGALQAAESPL